MTGRADDCIRKYGAPIRVTSAENPEGLAARGFISPAEPKDLNGLRGVSPAGVYDRERYFLVAESGAIAAGETELSVSCGTAEYELVRLEPVSVDGRLSHWEGVLRLKRG